MQFRLGLFLLLVGVGSAQAGSVDVSFEKFVAQCAEPEKSEVQRAPREIRVVCDNREVTWLAASPGEIPLPQARSVSTSILSDKFRVAATSRVVPSTTRAGTCHRFEEVVETYSLEIPMSCEEVVGLKVGVEELCASALDEGKDRNVKAIQTVRTGRVIDTCFAPKQGG
jgi:hypothetical protein